MMAFYFCAWSEYDDVDNICIISIWNGNGALLAFWRTSLVLKKRKRLEFPMFPMY